MCFQRAHIGHGEEQKNHFKMHSQESNDNNIKSCRKLLDGVSATVTETIDEITISFASCASCRFRIRCRTTKHIQYRVCVALVNQSLETLSGGRASSLSPGAQMLERKVVFNASHRIVSMNITSDNVGVYVCVCHRKRAHLPLAQTKVEIDATAPFRSINYTSFVTMTLLWMRCMPKQPCENILLCSANYCIFVCARVPLSRTPCPSPTPYVKNVCISQNMADSFLRLILSASKCSQCKEEAEKKTKYLKKKKFQFSNNGFKVFAILCAK